MKKYYISFLLLALSSSVSAQEITFPVPGIVCQLCVQGLKKGFKSYVLGSDKDNILVDLKAKRVTLKNVSSEISSEKIQSIVKDTGYNVDMSKIVRKGKVLKAKSKKRK